jgi:uncharacterized protein
MNTQPQSTSDLKIKLLVMKVASRCNLNCRYCYMYNLGDETYKNQPKVMSDEVVDAMLHRVKAHCIERGIDVFDFNFHGGEPLLAGPDFFRKFVAKANALLLPSITPVYSMQTNGTLLTDEWCELLGELDIHIGISLDGTPEANDMNRIDHAGRGSYNDIVKGIHIAMNSPHLNGRPGLLSVINVFSDPVAVYEHFKTLNPHNIDFILPDANHNHLPPGRKRELNDTWHTPYADWLIPIFDRWFSEKRPFGITMFESIVRTILGSNGNSEAVGSANKEQLVIETNGGIEPIGQLKICANGFTKLGANVLKDDFSAVLETDLGYLYHLSGKKLCRYCTECPVRDLCGSGYLPHRYSAENGFNNPSVYCKDLATLITHIQNRIYDAIQPALAEEAGLQRIELNEIQDWLKNNRHWLYERDEELEYFAEDKYVASINIVM